MLELKVPKGYLKWLCFSFGPLACKTLVYQPNIEPTSLIVEMQSLNHWTAREDPQSDSVLLTHVWWWVAGEGTEDICGISRERRQQTASRLPPPPPAPPIVLQVGQK